MDRSCIANVAPFGQNNIGKEKEQRPSLSQIAFAKDMCCMVEESIKGRIQCKNSSSGKKQSYRNLS